jgi:hypothetical protein
MTKLKPMCAYDLLGGSSVCSKGKSSAKRFTVGKVQLNLELGGMRNMAF